MSINAMIKLIKYPWFRGNLIETSFDSVSTR